MRRCFGFIGGFVLLAIAGPSFGQGLTGNAERGGQVAELWCSTCQLVSERQERATTDAPTFRSIAERSPEAIDALAGFVMDPHPPMPDLSLTREEIRDLPAYIASLD
jgi:cytochrome c